MLGFPTELGQTAIRQTSDGYEASLRFWPAMAYVHKLDAPPPGVQPVPYDRFVGQLGPMGLSDVDGMSGCPIFGFQKGREDLYWIVAVQASWLPKSRVIFGTPMPLLGRLIEASLDSSDETKGT